MNILDIRQNNKIERSMKMSKREAIKTTAREAVEYWLSRIDECGLSVDWAEAEERCR